MKKYIYILFGTAAIMACSKEAEISQADKNGISKDGTYTVTVYLDDVTKASINGSTGVFTWDGSEQIAIWDSANSEFVTFGISTYSNDGDKQAKFTTDGAKAGAVFDGNVAYYPASIATVSGSTPTYTFPTCFASLEAASKGFPMQGSLSGGNIHFTHLGCLINLTLNNVPSFTTQLILNVGSDDITISATPSEGVINAIVPIPEGEYALTAKLKDDNNNVFYTKSRSSKEYTKRNYYTINPITLRSLIEFTNASDITSVGIQEKKWKSADNDFTDYGEYKVSGTDYELYSRETTKYFVLPEYSWTTDLSPIRIVAFSSTYPSGSSTDVIFVRNITVDATESTMKMDYAIFPYDKNKALTNPSCYLYLPAEYKIYMNYTTSNWGDLRIHCWDNETYTVWSGAMTAWDSDPIVSATETINGTTYRVYTFTDVVDDKSFNIIFRAGTAQSADLSVSYREYAVHLFGDVYGSGSTVCWVPDASKTVYRTRLNGDWPGNDIKKTDAISTESMIPISGEFYGQTVKAKFSDRGSNVSSEWSITINRDYTYGY